MQSRGVDSAALRCALRLLHFSVVFQTSCVLNRHPPDVMLTQAISHVPYSQVVLRRLQVVLSLKMSTVCLLGTLLMARNGISIFYTRFCISSNATCDAH